MSHPEQQAFFARLKKHFPDMFIGDTLEIGSLNINGSIRSLFTGGEYIGVDVHDGPGVDLVAEGQRLELADESFNTVVSTECFEHNPYWLETFLNMVRMADNYVIFTCASTGRPEHGTKRTTPQDSPYTLDWDYYRNLSEEDFTVNINLNKYFTDWQFEYNEQACDLYFYGFKR